VKTRAITPFSPHAVKEIFSCLTRTRLDYKCTQHNIEIEASADKESSRDEIDAWTSFDGISSDEVQDGPHQKFGSQDGMTVQDGLNNMLLVSDAHEHKLDHDVDEMDSDQDKDADPEQEDITDVTWGLTSMGNHTRSKTRKYMTPDAVSSSDLVEVEYYKIFMWKQNYPEPLDSEGVCGTLSSRIQYYHEIFTLAET
jgi:hypothetical protein